ncbi:MAG: PD-(D/E)XK nuclease family protein [Planctomycetaceae bacterium]|nr:PD-(D/E)XK nuclease family protein [Planctomycetota bacterium]NUN52046.1 PD-(D/E)XK nuclease family protein [Planctomycetaceae bacterium]
MKSFPTSLETFRNCPRKFDFDRNPDIKRRYRKPSQAMFVGTCVHDALERFFDPQETPVPRRTHEVLVQYLRDAWAGKGLRGRRALQRREERRQVFGDDRETERAAGERAKHMLWGFVRTQDLSVTPYTLELFHEIPFGGRHVLAGKIDRIDRDGETLRVVDYKTGKAKTAAMVREEDLQLAAYSLIISRKFGVPVSRCSLLFLQESVEVGFEPDPAWLAAKEEELLGLLDRIEAEDALPDGPGKFPPTPNPLCSWCDYRELCPEGREFAAREEGVPADGTDEAPPF